MKIIVFIRRNPITDWLEAKVEQDGKSGENLLRRGRCSSLSEAKQRVRSELRVAIAAGVHIEWDIDAD